MEMGEVGVRLHKPMVEGKDESGFAFYTRVRMGRLRKQMKCLN